MKILHSIPELGELEKGCVVTIGNFDGLHVGHQEILAVAKKLAAERGTELLVITFDPHPSAVLHPEKAPEILTPASLKQILLEQYGVDCWLIINTTAEILSLSASEFIERFVVKPIVPVAVVEGEDFYFGSKRTGDINLLKQIGSQNNFEVAIVPAKKIELDQTVRVSSTMIRFMLTSADVADAAAALGRPYKLIGKITSGKGRGRQIGYPTLNMELPAQLIPAEGVYAGRVTVTDSYETACAENKNIPAVFSIGQARTFEDQHPLLIEAHLLTEPAEVPSGKFMAMDFIAHIRRQFKFSSPQELAAQITKDCQAAKDILR
ncbi:MAG: bifunctional riboflavin kinase/FAD synthetase [Phycisphaerae bacterium]|jgi:riboflavin kinase/FMN adenylyltransferase